MIRIRGKATRPRAPVLLHCPLWWRAHARAYTRAFANLRQFRVSAPGRPRVRHLDRPKRAAPGQPARGESEARMLLASYWCLTVGGKYRAGKAWALMGEWLDAKPETVRKWIERCQERLNNCP